MAKLRPFRIWYYFQIGYKNYFAFVFTTLNMMVVTYFLAIDKAPFLKNAFPDFATFAVMLIVLGLPILVFTGYIHFKRVSAFKSQQEITHESNPFIYKLGPGFQRTANAPHQLMMSKLMLKLMTNQKITEDEIKTMKNLQKKIQFLIDGGTIAHKSVKRLPFEFEQEDSKRFD